VKEFIWNPGDGYDISALERLQKHFKLPTEPMGEAWFISEERLMYVSLLSELDQLPLNQIMEPLEEISSGTSCFGYLEEWSQWYHYLLSQLIPRSHENYVDYLIEYLATGFFTQYPEGVIEEPYSGFLDDVLNTLGRCIMDKQCWDQENIVIGNVLCPSNNNPNKVWCWWDASGDFSSSMFFCIKYLPYECIRNWLISAIKINSPHWRAQIIVWLVGAYKILNNDIQQPSDFDLNDRPYIGWAWSHCIKSKPTDDIIERRFSKNFIPNENRIEVLQIVKEYITEEIYSEWLESISHFDYLESELAEIPEIFYNSYLLKNKNSV
jgi:hypothetical protein